jgi:hypothetical protein
LKTGNSRESELSCKAILLHNLNTVIVNDRVPNETLVLKKHVVVRGFTKIRDECIVICFLEKK